MYAMKTSEYLKNIGTLIQENRQSRGMTQSELAEALGTSQSAINRIEKGGQNISLEMIARIGDVLSCEIVRINNYGKTNFRVTGGRELHGSIEVKTSKNAAVALLCASLLNKGRTTLRRVARIEEVNRIIEVLESIGVKCRWLEHNDLEINPPKRLDLANMDVEAAKRTRSIIMFLGPLLHQYSIFELPFSGGCNLGTRTVEPHMTGLAPFGLSVQATSDRYVATSKPQAIDRAIVLTERGIGTTTLVIRGVKSISKTVEYYPSEDPIEAMSFVAAGIVTGSEITVARVPIEFMELELATLAGMGLQYNMTPEYMARNGRTRLVDITLKKSKLHAPKDKIHALPFPGINMDNLPFLGLCATVADGRTLIHDWSYENRAIYFTELSKLGGRVEMVDPHRVYITGPTRWKPADIIAPAALRPSVVILLAMMAAPGVSLLRDVYSINRGYEAIAKRLNSLGAQIETVWE